jgi:hypothetical protein
VIPLSTLCRVFHVLTILILGDIEAAGLSEQGLTGSVLLRIPAEYMAEQLFIFHLKYLVAVDPATDMSLLLDRSASQRSRSPLVFSQLSPHFLTRLVYTHILGLDTSDAVNDVSVRAKYLTRWIEIGQSLKARGDLAGFLAITTALLSMPVLRLKETWTDVDAELRNMVIREWSPMMKELHRRELVAEVSNWTAHVLTPDLKREELDSHLVIPYYGDICTALEAFDIWAVLLLEDGANYRLLLTLMWTSSKSKRRLLLLNMPSLDGSRLKSRRRVNGNLQKPISRDAVKHYKPVSKNFTPTLQMDFHTLQINSLKLLSKPKIHHKEHTSNTITPNASR